jgi:ATP-dependent RNA helicase RhlE
MNFSDLRLSEPILRAVTAEGYSTPSPIQAKAIPHVLEGRDLLGVAQNGTGKTAAFALPILHRLTATSRQQSVPGRRVRCLVLSPTRELASQIGDSFRAYGRNTTIRHTVIFGGVGQGAQVQALRQGVDVLVATPGRLLDLMNQGFVDLSAVEVFVLDEADRMLDMGFIHDIRRIVPKLPRQRQTLLFSATMPPDIRELARSILRDPVSVQVTPVSSTAERIEQFVYFVEKRNKPRLLAHVLNHTAFSRCLVFTRTKHGADRVAKHLNKSGIAADAIHGNKSQNQRERALSNFKSGKTPVLIASDIASRGIDIDDISHVVNFDLSNEPETYVHRIGRTARAGASGVAISFCDNDERPYLADIEKLTRQKLVVKTDHPVYPAANEVVARAMGQQAPARHPPQPRRVPHASVHAPRHTAAHAAHQPAQPRTDTPPAPHAPRHTPTPRRTHPLHAAQSPGVRFHGRRRGTRR